MCICCVVDMLFECSTAQRIHIPSAIATACNGSILPIQDRMQNHSIIYTQPYLIFSTYCVSCIYTLPEHTVKIKNPGRLASLRGHPFNPHILHCPHILMLYISSDNHV